MTKTSTLTEKFQLLKLCLDMGLSYDTIMMVLQPLSQFPPKDEARDKVAAILLEKLKTCKTEEEVIQKFQNQEA